MNLLLAILFVTALTEHGTSQAEAGDFEDPTIVSQPEANQVAVITRELIKNAETEREKLTSIYWYVINNISYDKSAYKNGLRRINKSNIDVLRRKKAVCWGYSELIREMCAHAGILCYSVSGYAIDLQLPIRSFEKANHAWNAVRIEGTWYLLDATWGSGVGPEKDYFMSLYDYDYFLTPPHLFIKNHFPLLPMWQLLSCPLSLDEFYAQSELRTKGCSFNYTKQIEEFQKLSKLEQEAQIIMVAYRMNRTKKNRSLLGHAIVDIAIEKMEKGEEYFEIDQDEYAIEELEASAQLFEIAKGYCDFYPWQEKAQVFTSINLVQAYFSLYKRDFENHSFVLGQFDEVRELLYKSSLGPSLKNNVSEVLDNYIEVLNDTIRNDK